MTIALITVNASEHAALIAERDRLQAQVNELQAESTRKQDNSLYRMVRRFHEKFGHPVRHTPAAPTEDEMRFRMSLILEEVRELYDACFDGGNETFEAWEKVRTSVNGPYPYQRARFRFNMEEAYDALLDIGYVVEGTHSVMGTRAEPGYDEVQRANMAKDPVYVRIKDSTHAPNIGAGGGDDYSEVPDPKQKPKKPADWTPPNIRGVLVAMGWQP